MKQNRVLRLAPEIWKIQFLTKPLLAPLVAAITFGGVTSAAFPFPAWQGALILLLILFAVFFYVAVDLNVKILYAGNVTDGVTESLFRTLKKAVAAVPKYGPGATLYLMFLTPVMGIGFGVAVAEGLDALSFEAKKALPYHIVYAILSLGFLCFGLAHIFCLHGVLLDGLPMQEAMRRSNALIRKHWKRFFKENISFVLLACSFFTLSGVLLFLLPLSLEAQFLPAYTARPFMILTLFLSGGLFLALACLLSPCYIIGLTRLYREYTSGVPVAIPDRAVRKHPFFLILAVLYLLEIAAVSSQTAYRFEDVVPARTVTRIVAHRGGGRENAENTLSGLETAIALGAYGSEIDVQRTIDGHYVLNHDATFSRVAGDGRMLKEMTLEEIKSLRYPVPTLEQTLDEAKGRILLFIELKGDTADRHMCNDVVRMVRERDMSNQVVLLCFKRNLIAYLETRWPEIRTGFLAFSVTEEARELPCDYLGLEEEGATPESIRAVREQGKKLLVWTPNSPEAQERVFLSGADAIITDNVAQAKRIRACLNRDGDLGRVLKAFQ